jgi:hypothetical protein
LYDKCEREPSSTKWLDFVKHGECDKQAWDLYLQKLADKKNSASYFTLKESHFWDADHIVAVENGGGLARLDELQTLCKVCHRKKTLVDNKQKRKQREKESESEKEEPSIVVVVVVSDDDDSEEEEEEADVVVVVHCVDDDSSDEDNGTSSSSKKSQKNSHTDANNSDSEDDSILDLTW